LIINFTCNRVTIKGIRTDPTILNAENMPFDTADSGNWKIAKHKSHTTEDIAANTVDSNNIPTQYSPLLILHSENDLFQSNHHACFTSPKNVCSIK
jgi:hypothetical protein